MNLLYFLYNKEPAHFNAIMSYVTDINSNKAVFQRVFQYPRHFFGANFATNSSTESHWETELKERFWQDQLADRFFSVLIEHPIEFHRIFTLIISYLHINHYV